MTLDRPPFARPVVAAAALLAALALFPIRESAAASRYTVLKSYGVTEGLRYREI